jgi:hypothetical protein
MFVTMLAPELVLMKAWEDLATAHDDLKELQDLSTLDGVEWTLTHSIFANIGGFVIRGNTGREPNAFKGADVGPHPESIVVVQMTTPLQQIAANATTDLETGQTIPKSLSRPSVSARLAASPQDQEPGLETQDPYYLTAAGVLRLRTGTLSKMPSIIVDGMHILDFIPPYQKSRELWHIQSSPTLNISGLVAHQNFQPSDTDS